MALKIQLRGGTAAEWTSANPVLMSREMGVETDTLKVKLGNGTTAWNSLPYFTQGAKGDTGPQGIQGETGATGAKGDTGNTGPANVITMGTVTTGAAGSSASATITGTSPNQTLNLVIPQGMKGDTGTAATITVGTVTALTAGSTPTVTNVGSSGAAVFDFGIPNAVGVPTGGSTGQVLTKTSSATAWADPAPTTLAGQSDVTITSPTDGQVLQRSAGKWTNQTLDISATKVQETSPSAPKDGSGWMYSPDGTLFLWNGVAWVQPSAPVAAQVEQRYYSPNYIINGAFDFWQRGVSFSAGGYTADRWTGDFVTGAGTVTQQAFTPGTAPVAGYEGTYFLRRTVTTGAQFSSLIHRVEDVRTLAGQTVTLSFWAKGTNPTGNFTVALIQSFGSGGSADNGTTLVPLVLNSTWTRYTSTVTLPSVAGKTIGPNSFLWLSIYQTAANTSSSVLDIWGVQLESGSTATAFRRNANSLQGELDACQRYYFNPTASGGSVYQRGMIQSASATDRWFYIYTPVAMRIPITASNMTFTLTASNGSGTPTFWGGTNQVVTLYQYIASTSEIVSLSDYKINVEL